MNTQDPYYAAFRGHFTSILSWDALSRFWDTVRAQPDGWFIYAVGEPLPRTARSAEETRCFLDAIDRLLREDHHEDYCGIVYTDSQDKPSFIKIFDPQNLGVTCGFSTHPPLPGWIMSRLPPSLLEDRRSLPAARPRWWRSLWETSSAA
jgi:hypothetical protein